jgi:hypothetical protein
VPIQPLEGVQVEHVVELLQCFLLDLLLLLSVPVLDVFKILEISVQDDPTPRSTCPILPTSRWLPR